MIVDLDLVRSPVPREKEGKDGAVGTEHDSAATKSR
jgi:hypothetical protein